MKKHYNLLLIVVGILMLRDVHYAENLIIEHIIEYGRQIKDYQTLIILQG